MSMPLSAPNRREPLEGLIVPTLTGVLSPLPVNAAPLWQAAQFIVVNTALPAAALADSDDALGRAGADAKAFSEATYAASASRSADRPAFDVPSGALRVPAAKSASLISPLPPASERIWPSKSCTSSKLLLQCRKPSPMPSRPRSAIVLRRPSPWAVRSQTRPSWPPSLWQLAQLM